MLVKHVEWKAPNFKIVSAIAESLDPNGAQSQIPPKVLLINDIRPHFECFVQEIGNLKMDNALGEMSIDGTLKLRHKHLEIKGLTLSRICQEVSRLSGSGTYSFMFTVVNYG